MTENELLNEADKLYEIEIDYLQRCKSDNGSPALREAAEIIRGAHNVLLREVGARRFYARRVA